MSFRDARVEELPKWAHGPQAIAYVGTLGQGFDDETDDIKTAIVERFPGLCDPANIDTVGGQYALGRFDDETPEAFRPRVIGAWETWGDAGIRPGIVKSLHAYGVMDVEIYESKGDH